MIIQSQGLFPCLDKRMQSLKLQEAQAQQVHAWKHNSGQCRSEGLSCVSGTLTEAPYLPWVAQRLQRESNSKHK